MNGSSSKGVLSLRPPAFPFWRFRLQLARSELRRSSCQQTTMPLDTAEGTNANPSSPPLYDEEECCSQDKTCRMVCSRFHQVVRLRGKCNGHRVQASRYLEKASEETAASQRRSPTR